MAKIAVAPLVGAWIEITLDSGVISDTASLPSWERGLKFVGSGLSAPVVLVAPLVGAWIEIILMTSVAWVCTCRSPRGSVD